MKSQYFFAAGVILILLALCASVISDFAAGRLALVAYLSILAGLIFSLFFEAKG